MVVRKEIRHKKAGTVEKVFWWGLLMTGIVSLSALVSEVFA